ncbi:DEAD/DEAH box helicase family protein [Nitrosovibrio sp. Nv17]|uniref:DEAD/DEAH box helicase family protein n=1 Tax=Nitrosovibrio sp. Nv17 TaxID=1855339 RepID=UPI000908D199|nr:DEAD/DEAH box helicase family protein [Nitrosovibrio sp. Nv17]SFW38065.1 hypothetical protein SAMN05216414_12812 [Nitrosovibrio sp. Nv17]
MSSRAWSQEKSCVSSRPAAWSRSGNPFDDFDLLVARVDQLARAENLQEKRMLTQWDLVVVDEAHKLSASYFGNKINKTKRFLKNAARMKSRPDWSRCSTSSTRLACRFGIVGINMSDIMTLPY